MKKALAAALLFLACGSAGPAEDPAIGGRAGEACPCNDGLVCKGARGDSLCLPADWFAGGAGAWCYVDSDCGGAGFTCDTSMPPLPYVDGRCTRAGPQQ